MGGIVIDIWEKSNFFGSFESQKGAKNVIFVQGGLKNPPPSCRVKVRFFSKNWIFKFESKG